MNWTTEKRDLSNEDERVFTCYAPAVIARNYESQNGIVIEAAFNYNGSGEKAFGGAKMWPHVKLSVGFQEGAIEQRDLFVRKLQAWLEQNHP